MSIGIGDAAAMFLLAAFGVLAWLRKKAGGKTWAFRIIPFGIMLMALAGKLPETWRLLPFLTFVAYALAAYRGGWRLKEPRNRILNGDEKMSLSFGPMPKMLMVKVYQF